MPRELITVQVGQCGNQVGCRFWDRAVREHSSSRQPTLYDDAMSSFFKNVDSRHEPATLLPVGEGRSPVCSLKARAVVVDTEEGVVNAMLKGPLGGLFDARSMLTDVSGAGNNWAHGHHMYGPQYRDNILERVRAEAEQCDSLQGFFLLHSLGGGTGSGLGTYLLSVLEDLYPHIFRVTASLFPSADDDVVTSPYNAMLALSELVQHASAVLPLENQALLDVVAMVDAKVQAGGGRKANTNLTGSERKPYDRMNSLAANALLGLTAGVRFEGPLNVDMNDITMNMVPFPRMHFLVPSMSPLATSKALHSSGVQHRAIDRLFFDVMSRNHQLMACDPRQSMYLACGLLARGGITAGDVSRNVATLRPNMRMVYWNQEGFKVGLCSKPPTGAPHSLLCLSNNCCVASTFAAMGQRFDKLFRRNVYVHHYTQFMEAESMSQARETVRSLQQAYEDVQSAAPPEFEEVYASRGASFL